MCLFLLESRKQNQRLLKCDYSFIIRYKLLDKPRCLVIYLGDLKTRKTTGTSCQKEIHFSSQTSKYLVNYNLLRLRIFGGLIIYFTEHDYKVSTSFINENKRYK